MRQVASIWRAAEVVHDHHVARFERRGEDSLDVEQEGLAVDRPVEDERGVDGVAPSSCVREPPFADTWTVRSSLWPWDG